MLGCLWKLSCTRLVHTRVLCTRALHHQSHVHMHPFTQVKWTCRVEYMMHTCLVTELYHMVQVTQKCDANTCACVSHSCALSGHACTCVGLTLFMFELYTPCPCAVIHTHMYYYKLVAYIYADRWAYAKLTIWAQKLLIFSYWLHDNLITVYTNKTKSFSILQN